LDSATQQATTRLQTAFVIINESQSGNRQSFALVELRGMTTAEAGLSLTSATIAWTAGAWATARLVARLGEARLVRIGLIVMAIGLFSSLIILTPAVPPLLGVATFGLAGFGIGIAYSPISLLVLALAPRREIGTATSGLQLSDVLGESIGTGVTGAILAAAVRMNVAPGLPLAIAFAIGLVVGLLALVLTVRLPARSVPEVHVETGAIAGAEGAGSLR